MRHLWRLAWLLLCCGVSGVERRPSSNESGTVTTLTSLETISPEPEGSCENVTNGTRCGGHEKKSKAVLVRMIFVEWTFNWMGLISYYTSVGALICGATQIVLAAISALLSSSGGSSVLSCFMLVLEVNVGSFFGVIYIGYLVTIPLFGRPKNSFFSPEAPHFGPPPVEVVRNETGDAFKIKAKFAVRNSIFLALEPYLLMMSIMIFLGSFLVMPIVCFFMGILVGLTRLADSVVRMLADDLDDDFRNNDEVKSAMVEDLGAKADRSEDLEKQADEQGQMVADVVTGKSNIGQVIEKEVGERMKMLEQIGGYITIPWWDDITQKYFDGMDGGAEWLNLCKNIGSCMVNCGSVCTNAFGFIADFFELMLAVGIPSFLKFNCDILFLLTVLGNFSITIPSFHFKLPDLGISALLPTFSLFDIDIRLPPLPSSPYPEWEGHCRATTALGLILNLIGSTFTATVVISSDILSCLYDRQSRIKLLKAAQNQKDKAHEATLGEKKNCFQRTRDKILKWKTWKHTVKASFYTGLVEVSTFAVLFSIGLIVNQATVFLVRLAVEIGAPNSNDGKVPEGYPACTDGVFALSKILAVLAMIVTLSYAYRVLSGHVHKDGIYILGAALVQEEKICQLVSLKRLVVIVRVCSFAFLLPFLSVGLHNQHTNMITERLREKRFLLDLVIENDDEDELKKQEAELAQKAQRLTQRLREKEEREKEEADRAQKAQRLTGLDKDDMTQPRSIQMTDGITADFDIEEPKEVKLDESLPQCESENEERSRDNSPTAVTAEDGLNVDKITAVKRNFAARSAMTESLFDLALNERGKKQMLLDREVEDRVDLRSVNDFHLFEFTECCKKMEDQRTTWYHPFLAMLGAPFGRMSNSDAIANRMAERCCIWQAQAESVHRASSYVHGIVLFLIPVGGTVAGKGLQILSDVPGLFSAKEKEICDYSFYQEPSDPGKEPSDPGNGPQILPSVWRQAAYFLGFLRVLCGILTISLRESDVFWAMSITNVVLATGQAILQKMDDQKNKAKIARLYSLQLQKDSQPPAQTVGCADLDEDHDPQTFQGSENDPANDQEDLADLDQVAPDFDLKSGEELKPKEKKKRSTKKSKAKTKPKSQRSRPAGADDT